jgi:hypothetical protein
LRANQSSFGTRVPIRPSTPQNDALPLVAIPCPKTEAPRTVRPQAVSHSLWTSLHLNHRGATLLHHLQRKPSGCPLPQGDLADLPAFLPPCDGSNVVGRRSARPVCSTLPRRTGQGDCGSLPLSAGYPTSCRTRHNQNLLGPTTTRRL